MARLLPIVVESARPPRSEHVLTEGFVVRPTELGLASPGMQLGDSPEESGRIWRGLPPLYWLLEVPELKPGARVLAEHPTRVGPDGRHLPVICFQYVGAGKVLFHATDENLAVALPGRRSLFRPLLDSNAPMAVPREARRPPAAR